MFINLLWFSSYPALNEKFMNKLQSRFRKQGNQIAIINVWMEKIRLEIEVVKKSSVMVLKAIKLSYLTRPFKIKYSEKVDINSVNILVIPIYNSIKIESPHSAPLQI